MWPFDAPRPGEALRRLTRTLFGSEALTLFGADLLQLSRIRGVPAWGLRTDGRLDAAGVKLTDVCLDVASACRATPSDPVLACRATPSDLVPAPHATPPDPVWTSTLSKARSQTLESCSTRDAVSELKDHD